MSLASAQRALASKNREILQDTASSKIGGSLMEGVGEGIAAIGGYVGEKFNVAENVESWENVEAGAEELGISKDNFQKPSLRQKWFKKPTDVLGDTGKKYKVGDDREITLGNLQHYGALAKSDSRSLYEHLAGGKDKFTEAYTTKSKTNLELQGMDASAAYKDMGKREQSPYMGNITEEGGGSYNTLKNTMPSGMFSETSNNNYEQTQREVQKVMKANKGDFDLAKDNYFKTLNEEWGSSLTQEQGQSYWDDLITKRNSLKPAPTPKTREKELGT